MDSRTNILFAFPILPPELQIKWLFLFNNALLTAEFIQQWLKLEKNNELWIHRDLEEGAMAYWRYYRNIYKKRQQKITKSSVRRVGAHPKTVPSTS